MITRLFRQISPIGVTIRRWACEVDLQISFYMNLGEGAYGPKIKSSSHESNGLLWHC